MHVVVVVAIVSTITCIHIVCVFAIYVQQQDERTHETAESLVGPRDAALRVDVNEDIVVCAKEHLQVIGLVQRAVHHCHEALTRHHQFVSFTERASVVVFCSRLQCTHTHTHTRYILRERERETMTTTYVVHNIRSVVFGVPAMLLEEVVVLVAAEQTITVLDARSLQIAVLKNNVHLASIVFST